MSVLRDIGSQTHPAEEGYLRDLCERHVRRSYDPAGVARQLIAVAASGDRTAVVRRIRVPRWCCMETRIRLCARPAVKKRRA